MAKTNIGDESSKFLRISSVLPLFCEGFLSYSNTIDKIDMEECEI